MENTVGGPNRQNEDKEGLSEGGEGPSYTEARGEYAMKREN